MLWDVGVLDGYFGDRVKAKRRGVNRNKNTSKNHDILPKNHGEMDPE